MSDLDEALIRKTLNAISLPDGMGPLGDSPIVQSVIIKDRNVQVVLEIDAAHQEQFRNIQASAEQLLRDLPNVQSAAIILTAANKPAPERQAKAPPKLQGIENIKHIIAVASGKGGVGKSTTAVNMALALAAQGLRIGILDADIYGPSLPRLCGLAGKRPTSEDGKILNPMQAFGISIMSIGFLVGEDQPVVWRGPMVMGALQQLLGDVAWGALDILVIDMPPGTGDAQLSLSQNVSLAGAVIVSTPQDLALIDARKGMAMFEKVEVPVLGIVENMSFFHCPHCGGRADIFGHGGARAEAEKMGVPFLGEVPLEMAIREQSDAGTPIVISDAKDQAALAYFAIAERLLESLQNQKNTKRVTMVMDD